MKLVVSIVLLVSLPSFGSNTNEKLPHEEMKIERLTDFSNGKVKQKEADHDDHDEAESAKEIAPEVKGLFLKLNKGK